MAYNNKVILVASLLMVILVASTFGQIVNAGESAGEKTTLEITYVFNKPTISVDEDTAKVELDNFPKDEIPGKPVIPKFSARILLSQGKDVKNVHVTYGKPVLLKTGAILEHGQPPVPTIIDEELVTVNPDPKIYGSDIPYPTAPFSVGTVAGFFGFNILHVNLFPVRYIPKAGNILYFPEITLHVMQDDGEINSLFKGDQENIQKISNMVDNPEEIGSYSSLPLSETTSLSTGDYDYVIITSESFTDDFQPLLNHKSPHTTTNIVNTIYISNNYVGIDLQQKIRNFIIDAYTNWGTTYVLLGGDVEVIPHRSFYCVAGSYTANIPSDLYYAGLDGTWDDDGDGTWGEAADNPDFYAEVYVGRAPVASETEITTFIDKVISFESAVKPNTVQLQQSRLRPNNTPDSRAIAEKCANWVPPSYTIDRLYEEDGTVTKTKWSTAFSNDHLIVQHTGHGATTLYHINYEVGGTVNWANSDAYGLVNNFLPIHMSIACNSGGFDSNDCLAEKYVLNPNGGTSASLLNSRYGWFSTFDASRYSGEFVERQFYELFHEGTENVGKMMQFAKENFATLASSNVYYRWCYYDINLLGDPESPALTMRTGNPPPTCTLTADPSSGEAPLTTIFSMTANDPNGNIASWELDVDNDGTAEYSGTGNPPAQQQHTYNDVGTYTAELTVWDNEGAFGYDTAIVTVTEPNNPPDTPSTPDPADGATDVSLNPTLSVYVSDPDGDALDVTFYDEYGVEIGIDTGVVSDTRASTVWSGLSTNTIYGWYAVLDDNKGGETTSTTWYFTTVVTLPPEKFYAKNDIPVQNGGITGDYSDTHASDNGYEGLSERKVGLRSKLEHKWMIDVTGGYNYYIFNLEASHTDNSEGDNFVFYYSTDDSTYSYMTTVVKTSDDDASQTYALPNTLSGTVYIKVIDTDRTKRNTVLDTIYIDHMYIDASGTPPPNREPEKPTDPVPTNGATNVDINPTLSVYISDPDGDALDVTFYDEYHIEIGTDTGVASGTRASTVWSGLSYETTYGWYTVVDDGEYSTASDTWSFTTGQEIPPMDMYVYDISWSVRTAGKNKFLSHTITVMSASGAVSDATVYSTLTETITGKTSTFSGITDTNGQVTFEKKCSLGYYEALVTDITHATYTYNSLLDVDNPSYYTLE